MSRAFQRWAEATAIVGDPAVETAGSYAGSYQAAETM
jgi:hypothetical protein